MKNGKRTFILTEIVLGLLVATLAFFMLYNKNEQKAERIAVVIPDIEESQWSAFKYGLKMASQEYGVNTVLISKANINMSEDEIEVVQQEIDKGADAIIVKMVGGSKEYSKLKKIQKKVPIMLAGESPDNNVEKKSAIPVTKPDQYDMGVALAGKLLENNNGNLRGKKIGIYTESSRSGADSKREKGVRDTLKDSGAKILWSVSRDEGIKKKVILQSQRKVDIVLALDDTSLVEAGEAAKQNNLSGAIVYGIGNSTEAVYYLDTRWAESLIVSDEFTAGYQCVAETVKKLRTSFYQMENQKVPYTILTRQNLFSQENQDLLFTLSQ